VENNTLITVNPAKSKFNRIEKVFRNDLNFDNRCILYLRVRDSDEAADNHRQYPR
jgi:hypothetical protein